MEKRIHRQVLLFLYCLLTAVVTITLCSRSSPIYPLNDWDDTNCFFTVGKAMMNGRVLYRDIYEQKGALLYFLYGLGWLVSRRDFLGAWGLEILCFAAFLRTAASTAEKRGCLRGFCLLMPGLAAILCSSYSFFLGGSAEEIALPFLYPALHVFLTTEDERGLPPSRTIVLLGALAGCVLWIKYTLLGLYVGYVLYIALRLLVRREFRALGRASGCFVLGAALATLPWLLYFGANGAVADWLEAYFFNNMSRYSALTPELGRLAFLREHIGHALAWNGRTSLLIALGALSVLLGRRGWGGKAGYLLMLLSALLLPFIGGTAFDYYGYAYAPLAVPGALAAARLLETGLARLRLPGALRRAALVPLCLCVLAGAGLFARRHSINSFYADYRKEDAWYTHFAAIIAGAEEQSLLNYGALDAGLYTVTGWVPQVKYFCHLNLDLPEMEEETAAYVREERTAFLLMTAEPPDWVLEHYEIVAQETDIYQFESVSQDYYLLKRRSV